MAPEFECTRVTGHSSSDIDVAKQKHTRARLEHREIILGNGLPDEVRVKVDCDLKVRP